MKEREMGLKTKEAGLGHNFLTDKNSSLLILIGWKPSELTWSSNQLAGTNLILQSASSY